MDISPLLLRLTTSIDRLAALVAAPAEPDDKRRQGYSMHAPSVQPSRRAGPLCFGTTEVRPNVFLCNGYLGAGAGQHRRLFLRHLKEEGFGLVVTVCNWAAARSMDADVGSVGAGHVLVPLADENIVRWSDLSAVMDTMGKAARTTKILINGFEHRNAAAMFCVAWLVYTNESIARAVELVERFCPGIRAVSMPARKTTPFQDMLASMERVRRNNPYVIPPPEDAEGPEARRARKRVFRASDDTGHGMVLRFRPGAPVVLPQPGLDAKRRRGRPRGRDVG